MRWAWVARNGKVAHHNCHVFHTFTLCGLRTAKMNMVYTDLRPCATCSRDLRIWLGI